MVSFDFKGQILKMMSLDLQPDFTVGTHVLLTVKASNISIAKNFTGLLSFSNQLKASVVSCTHGELLSQINVSVEETLFECLVTKNEAIQMDLKSSDEVVLLIKASELSILERVDD